jgi:hypothetical protein
VKAATSATLAILAAGQYLKFEFLSIAPQGGGSTLFYTNADVPLLIGSNPYLTGLTIRRGPITQKMGLESQQLDLEISPQGDNPAGAVSVGGYPFLRAVNEGVLDGAFVVYSKGFFNPPPAGSGKIDTTPGIVPFFTGLVGTATASRTLAKLPIVTYLELLNVAMPRNLVQTGCLHTLFDTGCGLNRASFAVSGTVTGTPTALQFNTSLTQVSGYFDNGKISFSGGVNGGIKRMVKGYVNASGGVTLIRPLPFPPGVGDTFSIEPGCMKTQAACSNASTAVGAPFNNLVHFRGAPFVPVPETLYDGGTPSNAAPTIGSQGGAGAGSAFSGVVGQGTYNP